LAGLLARQWARPTRALTLIELIGEIAGVALEPSEAVAVTRHAAVSGSRGALQMRGGAARS
jgi:hypothetical protein